MVAISLFNIQLYSNLVSPKQNIRATESKTYTTPLPLSLEK